MLLLTTSLFLKEKQIQNGHYPLQFKLTILVIIGILISFTLQGYGFYSILFSSLFQLLNYWFFFRFFRDIKHPDNEIKGSISILFVKTGLWLGLLSTLLPWGIGILSAKGHNDSELYHSFIYAFLHFQYNGWFLFVAIGLFFKCLEKNNVFYDRKLSLKFYWLFSIAVVPALSLSFLGMSFRNIMILPAYLAASLQIAGGVFFFLILKATLRKLFLKKSKWFQLFLMAFLLSFFLKIVLQFLSPFPIFEPYAFHNKNIVLAYLHLSLIGVISFLLLAILIELKWLSINLLSRTGNTLLLIGFIISELILALNGIGYLSDNKILFLGSAIMTIGIFLLFLNPGKYPRGKPA